MLVWGDTNHTEAMLAVQAHCLPSNENEPTNPTEPLLRRVRHTQLVQGSSLAGCLSGWRLTDQPI